MDNLNSDFPKNQNKYLRANQFQDQEIPLTYIGWKKKSNEDVPARGGKGAISWKQRLKYQMRYSYPELAIDEAGESILDATGKPKRNSNYDPKFPRGFSVVYVFEEGELESGSLPLFNAFCFVRPQRGDTVTIKRTGQQQETKWTVKRIPKGQSHASTGETPDFGAPEYSGDPEINVDEVPF